MLVHPSALKSEELRKFSQLLIILLLLIIIIGHEWAMKEINSSAVMNLVLCIFHVWYLNYVETPLVSEHVFFHLPGVKSKAMVTSDPFRNLHGGSVQSLTRTSSSVAGPKLPSFGPKISIKIQ